MKVSVSGKLRRKRGFALVLTLALLSFLLLLVVTLATSLRIETQTSFNNTQWNNARQNALMAMNVAFGQLQELAGPDQRVTATGGVLANKYDLPDGNQFWTGAWDSSNGNFLGWLVSDSVMSNSENILGQAIAAPGIDSYSVWMVNRSVETGSPDDDENKVAILKQPIRSTGIPGFGETEKVTTGNFAYWVSDEGVKVSALKTDTPIPNAPNQLYETRIRQLANRTTELNEWYNQVDLTDATTAQYFEQTMSFRQLEAIDGISAEGLARNFHNLTPASLGVLATTLDGSSGGLRQDLSQADSVSNGSIPINSAVLDFLNHRPNDEDNLEITPPLGGGSEPQHSIPIVTTEFAIRIGFTMPPKGDGPVKLYVTLRADIWNPHSLPLQNTPRDEPDFKIVVTGLPNLSVEYATIDGSLIFPRDSFEVDLGIPEFEEFEVDLFSSMPPGQVRNIYELKVEEDVYNYVDLTPGVTGSDGLDDDRLIIQASNSELNISIQTLDGQIIQEFTELLFDPLETEPLFLVRLSEENDEDDRIFDSEMPIRFWFRFHDEVDVISPAGLNDIERWSNELDPRSLTFILSDPGTVSFIEYDSDAYTGFLENDFIDRPEFFYGGGRGRRSNNFHRFFDLPTVEPISVAILRHLKFPAAGPNFLGNPNAFVENRVFDEWYFSSLPDSQSEIANQLSNTNGLNKRPFTNSHLKILGDPTPAQLSNPIELSEHALLFGAFNVNSTSADSWEMILSGNSLEEWDFRILYPGESAKTRDVLENPFYRLPFGADRHWKYPTDEFRNYPQSYNKDWFKTEWTPDWATSYTVGIREFTEDDIGNLASAIVDVIAEQEAPSLSVSDFLNKGILQQAIDRTDINTINGSAYNSAGRADRIPLNAPAFLNQADVLNTIAPFIQARSDTFRIRAYGDAVNPVTGKLEGRAWCEAWVQRVPELVDSSGDITQSATGLGRKFKIVHFKWLDESQI